MNKAILISFFSFCMFACSSKPQKNYDVTTLQTISYALLDLADRKRQLEQYEQALMLYREAESYALKRNDRMTAGLSKLKRAAIHIQLGQNDLAQGLIKEVENTILYEAVPLDGAVVLLKAQLLKANGEPESALQLLFTLETQYKDNTEKRNYYRMVAWSYMPSKFELTEIEQSVSELSALKKQHKLNNIEIYSYAIYHYTRYLAEQNNILAETYIPIAIDHFSTIELSNKIQKCYELAAQYYTRTNQPKKAEYHQQQADHLRTLLQD